MQSFYVVILTSELIDSIGVVVWVGLGAVWIISVLAEECFWFPTPHSVT